MEMNLPAYVGSLIRLLEENGYECYVVGGAVRSFLLHMPVHDYDLTTDAVPAEMKTVFRDYKTIETGLKHGTLTILSEGHPVEITTYRHDSDYSDHRHPEAVTFSKAIEEDCARRDFTVNALCYNPSRGFLDFFGGLDDLETRTIRCIGEADRRFDEDALRILRALRFAAALAFAIDPMTGEALLRNRGLLHFISTERINEELCGFLSARRCASFMQDYQPVFMECIPFCKEVTDEEWKKTLTVIDRTHDPMIRMALILCCCECQEPERTLREMKFRTADIRAIMNLLALQDADISDHTAVRKLLRHLQVPFDDYLSFRKALDPSVNDIAARLEYEDVLRRHECWQLRDMAFTGNDAKELGFRGKEISEVLEYLLDQVMEEKIHNRREDLILAAEEYRKKSRS